MRGKVLHKLGSLFHSHYIGFAFYKLSGGSAALAAAVGN